MNTTMLGESTTARRRAGGESLPRASGARALILALPLALSACMSLAPEYAAPKVETPPDVAVPAPATPWWQQSGDATLAALVEEALAHNANLLVAAARIEQARAALGLARANEGPSAGLTGSATRSKDPLIGQASTSNRYRTELAVSWELDFWGKYRDASQAAREQMLAAEANREALRLSLASEVAQAWYAYEADSQRLALAEQTLAAQTHELDLLRRRVDAGVSGQFELRQQEAEVAGTIVVVRQLAGARERDKNALGILLGRSPKAIVEGGLPAGGDIVPMAVPDSLPGGLPSSRLLQRPDVRAAESQLKAANWQIGVARAAWFPSLSLTASGGVASGELSSLFNSGSKVFSVGGSFAQPLLFSGRISSGIDSAKAARDAAGESYRQTVANAFREVLDALVARRTAQEVTQAEAARVAALAETLRLARLRYQSGLISQFELLGNERGLLAAQGNLIEARRAEASAAVQVWAAIGG
jgi:multidrug efflux system outer membrane protein